MRIVNMALAAALSVLAIASCGTRTGKKTTSEPAAETKAAQETETCITAIDKYLSEVIGSQYAPGEVCIPSHRIIAVDESNPQDIQVWGDFWVDNFKVAGDTLLSVSGGSHPGKMLVKQDSEALEKDERLSSSIDSINKVFGPGAVLFGVQGDGRFHMTQEHKSPRYTTRWTELQKVSVK